MTHLLLLVYLFLLVSGTVAAVILHGRYRLTQDPVFLYLYRFILFSLCRVTAFILFHYVEINLDETRAHLDMNRLQTLAHIPALIGMGGEIFSLGHVVCLLRRPQIHAVYTRVGRMIAWTGSAMLLLALLDHIRTGQGLMLIRLHQILGVAILATMAGIPALLILGDHSTEKGSARSLGWMLMAGLYPMAAIPISAGRPWAIVDNLFMVYVHLAPLFWSGQRLQAATVSTTVDNLESTLTHWVTQRKVTARERDIIRLIVQGKSNKEIEYEMDIAFSTVKNHLYNIYRKCGVQSRAQLIHLLLNDPVQIP